MDNFFKAGFNADQVPDLVSAFAPIQEKVDACYGEYMETRDATKRAAVFCQLYFDKEDNRFEVVGRVFCHEDQLLIQETLNKIRARHGEKLDSSDE